MLTTKQRIRLWWFKINNREYKWGIIQHTFDNYNKEPELFYEINKYIIYKVRVKHDPFYELILHIYSLKYEQYPTLQNIIKRLIREYIEDHHPDNYHLEMFINRTLINDCKTLSMFIIDTIKDLNVDYINIFNVLIAKYYHSTSNNVKLIYKYMVKYGADYKLILQSWIRTEIEQEHLVSNLCLLVKILKNVPSELMDISKLTNNIGQFMQLKDNFDHIALGSYVSGTQNLVGYDPNIFLGYTGLIPHTQNVAIGYTGPIPHTQNVAIGYVAGQTQTMRSIRIGSISDS